MKITFNTRHLGAQTVDTSDLSDTVMEYVIAYGLKQSIDDAGADPKKAESGSQDRFDNLMLGLAPSGGGLRVSPLVKAERELVKLHLVSVGYKSVNAGKLAKDPKDGFLLFIRERLAQKNGVRLDSITEEDSQGAFNVNWPKVETRAQAIVDTVKDTAEIDI